MIVWYYIYRVEKHACYEKILYGQMGKYMDQMRPSCEKTTMGTPH